MEVERLEAHGGGLIALTGGPDGPIDKALREGQKELALERLKVLEKIFGDRLYVEMQRHGLKHEIEAEPALLDLAYARAAADRRHQRGLFRLARRLRGARCAAVHRRGPLRGRGQPAPRVARALLQDAPSRWRELFADLPEALDNTIEIAKRCAFRPLGRKPILPRFVRRHRGTSEEEQLALETAELRAPGRGGPRGAARRHAAGRRASRQQTTRSGSPSRSTSSRR